MHMHTPGCPFLLETHNGVAIVLCRAESNFYKGYRIHNQHMAAWSVRCHSQPLSLQSFVAPLCGKKITCGGWGWLCFQFQIIVRGLSIVRIPQ